MELLGLRRLEDWGLGAVPGQVGVELPRTPDLLGLLVLGLCTNIHTAVIVYSLHYE